MSGSGVGDAPLAGVVRAGGARASVVLVVVAMTPIFIVEAIVVAFTGADLGPDGISTPVALALFVIQDVAAILCAVAFAGLRRRPKLWHFGLYAIAQRRALGWIVALSVGMLVFDALYFGWCRLAR